MLSSPILGTTIVEALLGAEGASLSTQGRRTPQRPRTPPLTDTTAPTGGTAGDIPPAPAARPDDAAKMQVVSNGKPLYYYAADTAPGETKGDNVGGTWHVARPA